MSDHMLLLKRKSSDKSAGSRKRIEIVSVYITWGLFAVAFLFLCYFIRTRIWTVIDSDMSSEMILAKMLNDEGRIVTPNWYYSTELRLFYVTQVFAVLFHFTDDWYVVRVYGEIVMHILLMASLWCMMASLGKKNLFPTVGLFLCLPFSAVYMKFVLDSTAYVPYFIASFLGIALIVWFKRTSDRRISILIAVASALNALVSSLIGFRQLVVFFLPIALAGLFIVLADSFSMKIRFTESRFIRYFVICMLNLFVSMVGCAFNVGILTRRYKVMDWNNLSFARFSFESVVDSLCGMICNLGYRESKMCFGSIMANGYAVLIFGMCVLIVYLSMKNMNKTSDQLIFVSAYFIFAGIVFLLLYSFTDMVYYDLYSLPLIVFVFPIVAVGISETDLGIVVKYVLKYSFVILVIITSVQVYTDYYHTDRTFQYREIVSYLLDNGYENGYGTFWNSNVLTELSDGVIDMYDWEDEKMLFSVEDVDNRMSWLQKVSHDTEIPDGKVFHLYSNDEVYFCNWKDNLREDDVIFRTADYVVYGFESHGAMRRVLMGD